MAKGTLENQRIASVATIHIILIILSAIFLLPLAWMISTSLKPTEETLLSPPTWIPSRILIENFGKAWNYNADTLGYVPFLVYGRNTIIICFLVVAGTVISNSIVGYSFARLKWPGRDLAFALTLATMMIPFPILMVPLFGLFKELGWIGTFRPLWVGSFFAGAFNIFLLRQFFRTIPFELSEAAKLDGCSEWNIFTQVILPLAKPALAVVALFSFLGTWNDFLGPLLYLQSQETFTLALGLRSYQSQNGGTDWNLVMAASCMVIAPVIILFFFAQKTFIQGIAATGLKG
ncbi:MAG: carbohydrate ABC transporter permease [Fimbriimonadaceae bacterium]|jgi:multiple sugar transport system permease protein|nr:carbohydrate ABC transporter permease [Fimbriimonadaceae bacterium]